MRHLASAWLPFHKHVVRSDAKGTHKHTCANSLREHPGEISGFCATEPPPEQWVRLSPLSIFAFSLTSPEPWT
jgi:hypothetical protein